MLRARIGQEWHGTEPGGRARCPLRRWPNWLPAAVRKMPPPLGLTFVRDPVRRERIE